MMIYEVAVLWRCLSRTVALCAAMTCDSGCSDCLHHGNL